MARAYKSAAQTTRTKLRQAWRDLLATEIKDAFDENNFKAEIEMAITNWQAQIGRCEATPPYLTYACPSLHTKGDPIDWSPHELNEPDFDVYSGILSACASAGARLFLTTHVRAHRKDQDDSSGYLSEDAIDYSFRGRRAQPSTTKKVVHKLINSRDVVCKSLPEGALNFRPNDMIQNTAQCDCPRDQPCSSPMLVIVPDMYEFVLHLLDDDRCAVADLLDYLKAKYSRKENKLILEAALAKIIDAEETRLRAGLRNVHRWNDDDRMLEYAGDGKRLVPAIIACHDMKIDFLLMKALRCLRGAPMSVLSRLLELCPSFPFDLIKEDLQHAARYTTTLSTRFHALKTIFKGKAYMELPNKKPYEASSRPIEIENENASNSNVIGSADDYQRPESPFFMVQRNGYCKRVSFAKAIQQQRATDLGKWFVSSLEELLTTRQVLAPANFGAMRQYVSTYQHANAYFSDKSVELAPAIVPGADQHRILPLMAQSTEDTFGVIVLLNNLTRWPEPLTPTLIRQIHEELLPGILDRFKCPLEYNAPLHLVSNCLTIGLADEACSIALKTAESYWLQRSSDDYTLAVMPFLCDVTATVKCRTFGTELEARWTDFYKTALQWYIESCAEDKPVKPSPVRQSIACKLGIQCPSCIAINAFCTSTDLVSTRIEGGEEVEILVGNADWKHVERQLTTLRECTRNVVDIGPNYRRVRLAKTWQQYEEDHAKWVQLVQRAKARLADIDQDVLRRMLGEDMEHYTEMRELEMRPHVDEASVQQPAAVTQNHHASPQLPTETQKRKADAELLEVGQPAKQARGHEERASPRKMMRRYLAAKG